MSLLISALFFVEGRLWHFASPLSSKLMLCNYYFDSPSLLQVVTHYVAFFFCEQITDLKMSVDVLEKERDFYFAKLRDIEIFCQMPELEDLPVRDAWIYGEWVEHE